MIYSSKKRLFLVTIFAIIMLSACSSKNKNTLNTDGIIAQAKAAIIARNKHAGTAKNLTRQQISKFKAPVIRVNIPALSFNRLAVRQNTNNGYYHYHTRFDESFTLYKGELTSTRGLPFDLMSATIGGSTRTYRYLNPENHIAQLNVNCSVTEKNNVTINIVERSYETIHIEKTCKMGLLVFKNHIWKIQNSRVIKSKEWISPELGYVTIEWLN